MQRWGKQRNNITLFIKKATLHHWLENNLPATSSCCFGMLITGFSVYENTGFLIEKWCVCIVITVLSHGLLFPTDMGIFSVLALPLLLLGISGIIYIYQSVRWLLSKSAVQNKVVVITDAISGLGKGELSHFFSVSENRNSQRVTLWVIEHAHIALYLFITGWEKQKFINIFINKSRDF